MRYASHDSLTFQTLIYKYFGTCNYSLIYSNFSSQLSQKILRKMSESKIEFRKNEIRAIIAFLWKKGLKPRECLNEMLTVLEENIVSEATVYNWFAELKRGRTSLEDEPHSGRPIEVTIDENVFEIGNLVIEDPRNTIRQIAE